jgi:hypothetical protein
LRTPISSSDLGTKEGTDDYLQQIIKYIPTEVIAFYTGSFATVTAALTTATTTKPEYGTVIWVIFIVALLGTILSSAILAKNDLKEKNVTEHIEQKIFRKTLMAVISFILWTFALGGPFALSFSSWYNQVYGTIAVGAFGLFGPKLYDIIPFYPTKS